MQQYFTYKLDELSLKGEKAFIETDATKDYEHVFTGYAIVWGGEPDFNGFTISRKAVEETLLKWRDSNEKLPLLYNHNMDNPFYNIGYVLSATVDEKGLFVTCAIMADESKTATQVWKLLKSRRVKEMSFFGIIEESTVGDYGEEHILKLEIKEVSVVFWGANKKALVETVKQSVQMLSKLQAENELASVTEHVKSCVVDCAENHTPAVEDVRLKTSAASANSADVARDKIDNILNNFLK